MQEIRATIPSPLGCPRNSADTEFRGIFWLLKWFLRNSGGISPELHRKSLPYSAECQNVTSVDTLLPSPLSRRVSKLGLGTEFRSEKIPFTKQQQNNLTKWFVCTSKVDFSDTIIEILGCCVLFWVGFSFTEWFRTAFREFVYIIWNSGKEFRAVFSSAEWFGTEFENLHLFWFHGTE